MSAAPDGSDGRRLGLRPGKGISGACLTDPPWPGFSARLARIICALGVPGRLRRITAKTAWFACDAFSGLPARGHDAGSSGLAASRRPSDPSGSSDEARPTVRELRRMTTSSVRGSVVRFGVRRGPPRGALACGERGTMRAGRCVSSENCTAGAPSDEARIRHWRSDQPAADPDPRKSSEQPEPRRHRKASAGGAVFRP
jgi:hypothetical protein